MPEEHVEICSFYLEKSHRVRRLLEEGVIVNVAFTTDENEVKTNELKTALEAAGVKGIDDILGQRACCTK